MIVRGFEMLGPVPADCSLQQWVSIGAERAVAGSDSCAFQRSLVHLQTEARNGLAMRLRDEEQDCLLAAASRVNCPTGAACFNLRVCA